MPEAPSRVVVATRNPGKLAEFRELLAPWEIVPLGSEVEENGSSYEENARLKARAGVAATGMPSLGDDSGLEVQPLGGYPGLHSARIAPTPEARIQLLLQRLADKPQPWLARFVCVIVLAWPDGREVVARGQVSGEIVAWPRGEHGFGYDPVFLLPGLGLTMAELPSGEKHRQSHRGRAAERLLELMLGSSAQSGYPMQPGNGR